MSGLGSEAVMGPAGFKPGLPLALRGEKISIEEVTPAALRLARIADDPRRANDENECHVCDQYVEITGEAVSDGSYALPAPGDGATVCESCDQIIHTTCVSAGHPTWCKACAQCDVCGRDAGADSVWVVRGSADIAAPTGISAQELLCREDYRIRAGLAA